MTPLQAGTSWPVEFKEVYVTEPVFYFAELNGATLGAARHRVSYRWFVDDALVRDVTELAVLSAGPTRIASLVDAGVLPNGEGRIELFVDDQLVGRTPFMILPGARPSERGTQDEIAATGLKLLLAGDFEGFDGLANSYRTSRARTLAGFWKLSILYHSIKTLNAAGPQDPKWQRVELVAREWLRDHASSPTAVVVLAKVLSNRAWACRDAGRSVIGGDDWRTDYNRLLEQTRDVLDSHAAVAAVDPEWHVMRITTATGQGRGPDEVFARATPALEVAPYYYGIHFAAVNGLWPAWGGSEAWIKRYVALAVERSRHGEGSQAYMRIYFDVASKERDVVYALNSAGAKQDSLRESYSQVIRAYPDPYNREAARSLDCIGGLLADYRELGRRGAEIVPPVAWWDSNQFRSECDAHAFEGKPWPRSGTVIDRVQADASFLAGMGDDFWHPLEIIGFVLLCVIEFAFWSARRQRRAAGGPRGLHDGGATFDPSWYPRTYLRAWGPAGFSNGLAVRLTISTESPASASDFRSMPSHGGRAASGDRCEAG